MKYKNLALALGLVVFSAVILLVSCKRINDYTQLGGDLIPEVDGINTFDTIIDIQAFNDTFTIAADTGLSTYNNTHYVGRIDNDPLFGRTDAQIALELKPSAYRWTFSNRPDSLHIDSVVLVLSTVETYGDTIIPQTFSVYELADTLALAKRYKYRDGPRAKGALLGSRLTDLRSLNDSVKVYKDTTSNQLRIRLDDAFGARLLGYDTTTANGRQAAYLNDSTFRSYVKGFLVESSGGNGLVGVNLAGANTKLAIYYKNDRNDAPVASWDTTVAYFTFNVNSGVGYAQSIVRDYGGTQLAANSDGINGTPDADLYLQNSPGSYAYLKIPGLVGLTNRVVHRAEIMVDQVWSGIEDSLFTAVNMYVDAWDPSVSKFQTVPYDVTFDASGNANLSTFGVVPYFIADPSGSGHTIKQWRFNMTRYVQNTVNGTITPTDLRLSMPFYYVENYRSSPGATPLLATVGVNAAPGKGRVRVHGTGNGALPGANPQRIRLRIVYSKI